MAPLADFLLTLPLPKLPYAYTHYVPGETPISSPTSVGAALVTYLAIVFGLQSVVRSHHPRKLHYINQAHNVFLSGGSFILLCLILEEVVPILWNRGLFYALCGEETWTRRLEFYYMVNYYTKYVELLDTVFLVLKKKPLIFLHVFHHSATALLCYTQLNGRTSISWVPITLNLTVHVVMYYYYYAAAGGAKIWWKKHVTTMQIVQFFIDLIAVYFGTYTYFAYAYGYPNLGNCSGSPSAAVFGCALLTSYLYLFIDFYFKTYNKRKAAAGAKAAGKQTRKETFGKVEKMSVNDKTE